MKKTQFDKFVETVNKRDDSEKERAAERMRPFLEKMNDEIADQRDIALLEGDGMALAVIHATLKRHMDEIEKSVNRAKAVFNVTDDGEMELTLADGRKISAQRTIKREV